MISAIDSRISSPLSIQLPEQFNDIQGSSSPSKKAGRIRTGVAECNDSFEKAPANKANELDAKKVEEFRMEIREKDKTHLFEKKVIEKQKAEQAKAYRPDQQG